MRRDIGMNTLLLFIAAAVIILVSAGCGESKKEAAAPGGTVSIDQAGNVGSDSCKVCHSALTHTVISGIAGVNPDPSGLANAITHECEACHGGGQYHFGMGPIPIPSPSGDRCAVCHTQTAIVVASKHNAEDAANYDMIADSYDTGKCQRCHTAEGSRAFATIIGSKTAYDAIVSYGTTPGVGQVEALNNVDASGNRILHNPTCAACHNPLSKEIVSIAGWDPNGNTKADQFDMCTSCHVYRLNDGTLIGSGLPLQDGAGDLTSPFYHDTAWYRVLRSTHYDNPDTGSIGDNDPVTSGIQDVTSLVEGYIIRENSADPCFDCHGHNLLTNTGNLVSTGTLTGSDQGYVQNPNVEPTIYTDWAKSAHAGGLLKVKYASQENGDKNGEGNLLRNAHLTQIVTDAAADDTTGPAWTHYNWDRSGRSPCQRCHTSTGLMNFLNNPAGYVAANNNFSHLSGWTGNEANGSPQNEMLYCWGCHSNAAAGVLRNPGALSFTGTNSYTNGATAIYPDVAGSNICMACHTGRETGDSIKLDPDADGVRSFINSHYLAAGGTVFTTTGYEYAGRNYNNVTFYAHDKIGTTARPGTGSNGPCVGCHMSTEQSHLFIPVEKDEITGDITAITSTVCASCHNGGYALTPTVLMDEEHEFVASIEVLKAALASKGMFFANSHPYFHIDTNANQILDPGEINSTNGFTNWAGVYDLARWKDTMGAAFNANLLIHDPGGFAHNRYYAKGLIWDSIDFIDNGVLDNSVPATITALTADPDTLDTTVDPATAAAANTYLGASRPGDTNRIP